MGSDPDLVIPPDRPRDAALRSPMSSTRADAPWREVRERGSPRLLAFMIWVTRKLGRTVGRAFLPPIVVYFLVFGLRAHRLARLSGARAGGGPRSPTAIATTTFAATLPLTAYFLSGRWDFLTSAVRHGGCGRSSSGGRVACSRLASAASRRSGPRRSSARTGRSRC
jgi:hypothetical protein